MQASVITRYRLFYQGWRTVGGEGWRRDSPPQVDDSSGDSCWRVEGGQQLLSQLHYFILEDLDRKEDSNLVIRHIQHCVFMFVNSFRLKEELLSQAKNHRPAPFPLRFPSRANYVKHKAGCNRTPAGLKAISSM